MVRVILFEWAIIKPIVPGTFYQGMYVVGTPGLADFICNALK